ncbi:MAG TPA: DNA/RNA non-specific endonuclease [Thermoanaerobaculia bacterium]|nr:DNA/RNA non-specific endonuclease [Thermoanaerobaculia bacterium]
MKDFEARVRAAVARIERRDQKLAEELNDVRGSAGREQEARVLAEKIAPEAAGFQPEMAGLEGLAPPPQPDLALETIVLRVGRPVLAVLRDEAQLEFRDAESEIWRQRLVDARDHLTRAIKAVGRIEVANHPRFEWLGTGWLISEDVVVTNRHVANEFGRRNGAGFVFRQGPIGRTMRASIDFLEEFNRLESLEFRLKRILHIEGDSGPDIALLQVEPAKGRKLAAPIALASRTAQQEQQVAVIGYPAKDSRIPDQQLMQDIFGNVFDKKRLAPGQITGSQSTGLLHDCSTLGGNSGSVVLDLASGEALGLHFAGRFLEANFAVPAALVADRLRGLGRQAVRSGGSTRPSGREIAQTAPVMLQSRSGGATASSTTASSTTISYTIPIRVTVDIGAPVADGQPAVRAKPPAKLPKAPQPIPPAVGDDEEDDELLLLTEARAEDYADRTGYDPAFLGEGFEILLPELGAELEDDILTYDLDGEMERELRYQHYSVVMNGPRRMCFFSAVNLDGKQSRRSKRVGWRFDPRIPQEFQILKECYGNAPKFSRGHMTRREDPVWGPEEEAELGNADSMHATNAVPQMQVFNAGIWLGLEDYALDHSREDEMRISVFTGPFLRDDDPEQFGVTIPRSFWKVIAFIHDETGELTATGYTMSQEAFLSEQEFVFGQHETAQVPISSIEQQTGLSFGDLASRDPLAGEVEEALPGALTDFRQIRFV